MTFFRPGVILGSIIKIDYLQFVFDIDNNIEFDARKKVISLVNYRYEYVFSYCNICTCIYKVMKVVLLLMKRSISFLRKGLIVSKI